MGWSGLPDDHHERGDLAELTPDADRLFNLLISFTNTPQRKGRFTRLEAAALARSRKYLIDLDVALPDLLDPEHPQIEEMDGGYRLINNEQYHVTPQKSAAGRKGGEATRDSGALAETRDKRWPEDDSLSRLKAGSKHPEDGSKLSPSPSPSPSTSPVSMHTAPLEIEPNGSLGFDGYFAEVYAWAEQNHLTADKEEVDTILAGMDLTVEDTIELLEQAVRLGKAPTNRKLTTLLNYLVHSHDGAEMGSIAGRKRIEK
jgi:hypothetical protein